MEGRETGVKNEEVRVNTQEGAALCPSPSGRVTPTAGAWTICGAHVLCLWLGCIVPALSGFWLAAGLAGLLTGSFACPLVCVTAPGFPANPIGRCGEIVPGAGEPYQGPGVM